MVLLFDDIIKNLKYTTKEYKGIYSMNYVFLFSTCYLFKPYHLFHSLFFFSELRSHIFFMSLQLEFDTLFFFYLKNMSNSK